MTLRSFDLLPRKAVLLLVIGAVEELRRLETLVATIPGDGADAFDQLGDRPGADNIVSREEAREYDRDDLY